MWISKEELQKLVEKKAKDLCISNRIEFITKERELSKRYIQRLEHEKNELSKYRVKVVSINSGLRAELNELKEENDKFKKANDSLYKRVSDLSERRDDLERQIEMLEDDKKELQELYVATRKVHESLIPKCQKLHSENEVLIKENEELKNKELKDTEKICDGINDELLNLCTKLSDENMLLIHKQPIIREDKPQPKQKEETPSVKPTYFTMGKKHKCLDLCEIINDEVKIGSLNCQDCDSCVESNIKEQWVKCSKRPEGKPHPNKPTERFKRDQYGVISEVDKDFVGCACELCVYKTDSPQSKRCTYCDKNLTKDEYYSSK